MGINEVDESLKLFDGHVLRDYLDSGLGMRFCLWYKRQLRSIHSQLA